MTDDNLPARLVPPLPGETGRSHWRISPLGIQMVSELAARGCHVATIARALGMSIDAFRAARQRQPDAEEAYQTGLAREHDVLVSNLRRLADADNVVANLFLLKARHGYREGSGPEVNVNISNAGVLVVPQKQSMEQFLADNRDAPSGVFEHEGPAGPGLSHPTPGSRDREVKS